MGRVAFHRAAVACGEVIEAVEFILAAKIEEAQVHLNTQAI